MDFKGIRNVRPARASVAEIAHSSLISHLDFPDRAKEFLGIIIQVVENRKKVDVIFLLAMAVIRIDFDVAVFPFLHPDISPKARWRGKAYDISAKAETRKTSAMGKNCRFFPVGRPHLHHPVHLKGIIPRPLRRFQPPRPSVVVAILILHFTPTPTCILFRWGLDSVATRRRRRVEMLLAIREPHRPTTTPMGDIDGFKNP